MLYSIFEWPVLPNSRIVLIGVANALDLTERTLPRLQARCSLKPHTLHFAPYTKEQIIKIFVAVLANDDKANVFSPVALQMLAGKYIKIFSQSSVYPRKLLSIRRKYNISLPMKWPFYNTGHWKVNSVWLAINYKFK